MLLNLGTKMTSPSFCSTTNGLGALSKSGNLFLSLVSDEVMSNIRLPCVSLRYCSLPGGYRIHFFCPHTLADQLCDLLQIIIVELQKLMENQSVIVKYYFKSK